MGGHVVELLLTERDLAGEPGGRGDVLARGRRDAGQLVGVAHARTLPRHLGSASLDTPPREPHALGMDDEAILRAATVLELAAEARRVLTALAGELDAEGRARVEAAAQVVAAETDRAVAGVLTEG